jgi:hypothetical protein
VFNAWFILYHKYSRQAWYDAAAVQRFAADCAWAARNDIRLLIIEGYFRNYPEYLTFWSGKTLKAFLNVAHDHGIPVLPYASPATMDVSSDFYRFHGEECAVRVPSVFGTPSKQWGFTSLPDGAPYWQDYRGTHLAWVYTDPATAWNQYYLEQCEGLLEFGFDGIYIDQYQQPTQSVDHPDVNARMLEMLTEMRGRVKAASPEHLICANVMSAPPQGEAGEEFVKRTMVADYALTESADADVAGSIHVWTERTGLSFFFLSHGTYESHRRKVEIARAMGQPLCLLMPTPLDEADPRILQLYETA